MPSKPPRPCCKPGCRHYAEPGSSRCKDHPHPSGWSRRGSGSSRGYGYEWSRTRERILKRDRYLCTYYITHDGPRLAKQVDHRTPKSQGGTDDESNLGAICYECHAAKSEAERRYSFARVKRPSCKVVVVWGPPGAGKSTYCRHHAGKRDLIIDFDTIIEELSGLTRAEVDSDKYWHKAVAERMRRLDNLHRLPPDVTVWIPVTLPRHKQRATWQKALGAEMVALVPEIADCIDNIQGDVTRGPLEKARGEAAVIKWFEEYEI